MQLNPREYDIRELRAAAREPAAHGDVAPGRRPDGGAAVADRPVVRSGASSGAVSDRPPWAVPAPDKRQERQRAVDATPAHLRADHDRQSRDGSTDQRSTTRERRGPDGAAARTRGADNGVQTAGGATGSSNPAGGGRPGWGDGSELAYASLSGQAGRKRPYLRALPGGVTTDLVVLEWLEGLVARAGCDGAADALAYYADIDWLTEGAADHLQDYLAGLQEPSTDPPGLTTEDHRTSLRYLVRLAGLVRE
jgi:hypothetical protein